MAFKKVSLKPETKTEIVYERVSSKKQMQWYQISEIETREQTYFVRATDEDDAKERFHSGEAGDCVESEWIDYDCQIALAECQAELDASELEAD